MAEQNQAMYGYQDDNVSTGTALQFGLNAGTARMTKFEWINDAGKDGSEGEALDIQFEIEGGDRPVSYRKFPITKAFDQNGNEINDPSHPAFQKTVRDFNAVLMHIMHVFVDKDVLQQALATPIASFKEFCKTLSGMLPSDYANEKLDLFGQWQWQMVGENKRTYVELPKNMKHGRWICKAEPCEGSWHEEKLPNPSQSNPIALKYVDDAGKIHPFKRNGWFMLSNFAVQQVAEQEGTSGGYSPTGGGSSQRWEAKDTAAPENGGQAEGGASSADVKDAQQKSWNDLANQQ